MLMILVENCFIHVFLNSIHISDIWDVMRMMMLLINMILLVSLFHLVSPFGSFGMMQVM